MRKIPCSTFLYAVLYAALLSGGPLRAVAMGGGDDDAGREIYKKANCIGCHKWHGGGGGGYGGAARSLRETALDAAGLKDVIRCGRPFTGMPFHQRGAYQGDDTSCYNVTGSSLGDGKPPRARSFLRDQQIDAVVDYVMTTMQGKGEPSVAECEAFWGADSRQCDSMR